MEKYVAVVKILTNRRPDGVSDIAVLDILMMVRWCLAVGNTQLRCERPGCAADVRGAPRRTHGAEAVSGLEGQLLGAAGNSAAATFACAAVAILAHAPASLFMCAYLSKLCMCVSSHVYAIKQVFVYVTLNALSRPCPPLIDVAARA